MTIPIEPTAEPLHPQKRPALEAGDLVILAGLALVVIGVGLWSVPAAFVVAGLAVIAIGWAMLQPRPEVPPHGALPPAGFDAARSADGRDDGS